MVPEEEGEAEQQGRAAIEAGFPSTLGGYILLDLQLPSPPICRSSYLGILYKTRLMEFPGSLLHSAEENDLCRQRWVLSAFSKVGASVFNGAYRTNGHLGQCWV